MTSPSQAFNKAIAGVNDFMTSPTKKAALTYSNPRPNPTPAIVRAPSGATNSSKMPKGTVFGSNMLGQPTSQSKALQAKLK
jgi:hypothetical protein